MAVRWKEIRRAFDFFVVVKVGIFPQDGSLAPEYEKVESFRKNPISNGPLFDSLLFIFILQN